MATRSTPEAHAQPFVHDESDRKSLRFAGGDLQSCMRVAQPDVLEVEYTRAMMGFLLFNHAPRAIVMIGLGGGSLAKYCHRHLPATHITAVEINPHVLALRDDFRVPPDSERFRIIEADGADYVRPREGECDVLMVDGFDDSGQPARLCSQSFYDDCHQMLSPEGLLVVNLHSEQPQRARLVSRIERSFVGDVLELPIQREGNCVVFASKGPALRQRRQGVIGRQQTLNASAWSELKPTFAQILLALKGEETRIQR